MKSFELLGDHYWGNHVGMFTVPFHFAVQFDIPLVVYGEIPNLSMEDLKRAEIISSWIELGDKFGLMRNFREEDMIDHEISSNDLQMLYYPEDEVIRDKGDSQELSMVIFSNGMRENT